MEQPAPLIYSLQHTFIHNLPQCFLTPWFDVVLTSPSLRPFFDHSCQTKRKGFVLFQTLRIQSSLVLCHKGRFVTCRLCVLVCFLWKTLRWLLTFTLSSIWLIPVPSLAPHKRTFILTAFMMFPFWLHRKSSWCFWHVCKMRVCCPIDELLSNYMNNWSRHLSDYLMGDDIQLQLTLQVSSSKALAFLRNWNSWNSWFLGTKRFPPRQRLFPKRISWSFTFCSSKWK